MTVPLDGRGFVVGSAATALAAGGIEGILAARRAPAQQAGVEIAVERINQNDIQARTTAAIQSGSGPTSSSSTTTTRSSTRAPWPT